MSVAVPLTRAEESAADVAALLYERHSSRIFAFCLRRLRSREEAEDAVQQTFLKAFAAMRGGFRPSVERAWLYRIAENVCADRLRATLRRGQHERGDVDSLSEILPAREAAPPIEGLDRALLELTPSQRQALLLREWQGLSYHEIGAQLRLSDSAVETLLFRARRSLARRLDDQRTALRSWIGEAGALAGWLKSALSGGAAVKATVAVVAAGTVGAAAVAPLVADEGQPFRPPPALSVQPESESPAADVQRPRGAIAPQPAVPRDRARAPSRGRTVDRPAGNVDSPTTPAPTTTHQSPPVSRETGTPAPASTLPNLAPQQPPAPQLPQSEVPVTPPPLPLPEVPVVPELPAPTVDVPPVEETVAPVTDALPELPKLP